mmetsp:Transcript_4338/g.13779  ORF Transcript_4338/g.13779 Transcript_4338/m.13779 type:complete len:453 (-) Transcript_4338:1228-2586(-)
MRDSVPRSAGKPRNAAPTPPAPPAAPAAASSSPGRPSTSLSGPPPRPETPAGPAAAAPARRASWRSAVRADSLASSWSTIWSSTVSAMTRTTPLRCSSRSHTSLAICVSYSSEWPVSACRSSRWKVNKTCSTISASSCFSCSRSYTSLINGELASSRAAAAHSENCPISSTTSSSTSSSENPGSRCLCRNSTRSCSSSTSAKLVPLGRSDGVRHASVPIASTITAGLSADRISRTSSCTWFSQSRRYLYPGSRTPLRFASASSCRAISVADGASAALPSAPSSHSAPSAPPAPPRVALGSRSGSSSCMLNVQRARFRTTLSRSGSLRLTARSTSARKLLPCTMSKQLRCVKLRLIARAASSFATWFEGNSISIRITYGITSVYVNIDLHLSSTDKWYNSRSAPARNCLCWRCSTSLGISDSSSICSRAAGSNERLNRTDMTTLRSVAFEQPR